MDAGASSPFRSMAVECRDQRRSGLAGIRKHPISKGPAASVLKRSGRGVAETGSDVGRKSSEVVVWPRIQGRS